LGQIPSADVAVTYFLPYLPLVYKDMAYDEITPPSGPAQAFPGKVSNY
jgi:hypothetical protein